MNSDLIGPVPPFYQRYANRMVGRDLLTEMAFQRECLLEMLRKIPASKGTFSYAEGKWTINELVQHITDAERVFAYRAMCFARGEKHALPGFEEDDYVAESRANEVGLNELLEEFTAVREASMCLFRNFNEATLARTGVANGNTFTVAAHGVIIVGHAIHHTEVLAERYIKVLNEPSERG